jgi:hypothetical protein
MSSSSQVNMQAYSNILNKLSGGKKRKQSKLNRKRSQRRNRNRAQNQDQNQTGGFFPGIGEVVSQAIVPFGLYAAQHKFKSSSGSNRFRNPSKYSFKKLKKFKFTRKL